MQPREYSRVNAVGLDLGVCDHARLQRVRDASGMRLEQPHDGHGIAGGLQYHLVIRTERARELKDLVADQVQSPALAQHAIL
jgi:hypothetical protein